MAWRLQDAQDQFSKLVRNARSQGPQIVTLGGERTAVVLSTTDYDALTSQGPSIIEDLLAGPAWDDELARVVDVRASHSRGKTGV